jgi:hypothetical protein
VFGKYAVDLGEDTMTRKDYIKLAQVFRKVKQDGLETLAAPSLFHVLKGEIAEVLAIDNPRFDLNKWNDYIG